MAALAERVKGIIAIIQATILDIAIYFEDDVVTSHEWFLIMMITLGAVGVYLFPNTVNGQNAITTAKNLGYRPRL